MGRKSDLYVELLFGGKIGDKLDEDLDQVKARGRAQLDYRLPPGKIEDIIGETLGPRWKNLRKTELDYLNCSVLERIYFQTVINNIDDLHDDLLNFKTPKEADVYGICINSYQRILAGKGPDTMETIRPFRTTFQRTLQRLKEKGTYCKDLAALGKKARTEQKMHKSKNGQDLDLFSRGVSIMVDTLASTVNLCEPLPDSVWYAGIEMTMLAIAPQHFCDVTLNNFASYLEGYEPLLYAFTMLAYLTYYSYDNINDMKMLHGYRDRIQEIIDDCNDAKERLSKSERENEELNAKLSTFQADTDKQLKELRINQEKETRTLQHQFADEKAEYLKTIAALQSEVDYLIFNRLTQAEEQTMTTQEKNEKEKSEEAEYADVVLPEDNVLFIGGHPNMLNKLAPQHPDWVFINDGEYTARAPLHSNQKYTIAFCWTGHLSHKLFEQASLCLADKSQFIYLTSTNIDMLETEMKKGYLKELRRVADAGDQEK